MLPYLTKAEIDAVYGGVGRTGTPYDRKRVFYNLMGYTGTLMDQERAWLSALGYSTGSLRQRWSELLVGAGYTGTLGDKFRSWAVNAGTNLLTYSEQFDNAAWVKTGTASVSPDVVVAPDGNTTADTVTFGTGFIYQAAGAAATQYTFSIWISGSGTVRLKEYDDIGGDQIGADITMSATMTRHSITKTVSTGATDIRWGIVKGVDGLATEVTLWGAQLGLGSFASPYKPRTA